MNHRVSPDPLQLALEEREVKEEGVEGEEVEGVMSRMPPPSQSHNSSSCNNTRLQFSIANIMGFDVRGEPREKEEEKEEEEVEDEEEMGVQVESSSSHGSDMAKERLSLTIHKVFFSEKVESSSSYCSDMAKEWLSLTIYKVVLISKTLESSSSHCSDMVVLDNIKSCFKVSKKVESTFSHGSDKAQEWLSLTIHKVFIVVKRWSPVLVTGQTWPRNGCL
jgi:hypothetical protein